MAPQCKHEFAENNVVIDEINGNASSTSLSSTERRIRFALNMEEKVIVVESHKDYSPIEFEKCFWTPQEQEKMRTEQLKTIARMEKGKKAKKEDYRGLESGEIAQAFEQKFRKCVTAVMKAQAEQDKVCADSLADVSKTVTAESAKKALMLAQKDAQEAEIAWTEPKQRRKSLPKRILSKLLVRNNSRQR
ncbi:unnamed protein product [Cylindrotheca closterium]|uniref:Uncharacterized protein n=1 Tax=Cylindrotheca closterium TaxID=2856 RepID=A0AAD2GBI1_9STRA|nr:unnamed protein product [Cylindrotheca closterium]